MPYRIALLISWVSRTCSTRVQICRTIPSLSHTAWSAGSSEAILRSPSCTSEVLVRRGIRKLPPTSIRPCQTASGSVRPGQPSPDLARI
ncbi:hypothetical protein C8R47DRAFT_1198094 [Mycena vitilis]|nr:hypothetical protein C8R47DRAFT_1198094 [Mycena vitilis]